MPEQVLREAGWARDPEEAVSVPGLREADQVEVLVVPLEAAVTASGPVMVEAAVLPREFQPPAPQGRP